MITERRGSGEPRCHLDDECDHDEHQQSDDDERGEGAHGSPEDSDAVNPPGIEFLTRVGCPLCDAAFRLVDEAARHSGVSVVVIDIDMDLSLLETFDHRVPVVRDGATGDILAEGQIDRMAAAEAMRTITDR